MSFGQLVIQGIWETLYMTLVSTVFAYIIGIPIAVVLSTSRPGGINPRPVLYPILSFIVNIMRSVPFLILLVAIFPLTRFIAGTIIGATATIVPLTIAAAPFVARLVEGSLNEVDAGVVEAAQSMGASHFQIVTKVLIPEAKPSLITNAAVATITILGYSALAGFTGGGGLGDLAVRYGYYKFDSVHMWEIVLIIVVIVQLMQEIGTRLSRKTDKRVK